MEEFEAELGGAEGSSDIYKVAGASAGARDGLAGGEIADDGDADDYGGADGDVAADKEETEFAGGATHARGEAVEPIRVLWRGQSLFGGQG